MTTIDRYGDAATLVRCAPTEVLEVSRRLTGVGEVVPGLESVAVLHGVGEAAYDEVVVRLAGPEPRAGVTGVTGVVYAPRLVEISVCYDGRDLEEIARATARSTLSPMP